MKTNTKGIPDLSDYPDDQSMWKSFTYKRRQQKIDYIPIRIKNSESEYKPSVAEFYQYDVQLIAKKKGRTRLTVCPYCLQAVRSRLKDTRITTDILMLSKDCKPIRVTMKQEKRICGNKACGKTFFVGPAFLQHRLKRKLSVGFLNHIVHEWILNPGITFSQLAKIYQISDDQIKYYIEGICFILKRTGDNRPIKCMAPECLSFFRFRFRGPTDEPAGCALGYNPSTGDSFFLGLLDKYNKQSVLSFIENHIDHPERIQLIQVDLVRGLADDLKEKYPYKTILINQYLAVEEMKRLGVLSRNPIDEQSFLDLAWDTVDHNPESKIISEEFRLKTKFEEWKEYEWDYYPDLRNYIDLLESNITHLTNSISYNQHDFNCDITCSLDDKCNDLKQLLEKFGQNSSVAGQTPQNSTDINIPLILQLMLIYDSEKFREAFKNAADHLMEWDELPDYLKEEYVAPVQDYCVNFRTARDRLGNDNDSYKYILSLLQEKKPEKDEDPPPKVCSDLMRKP